MPDHVCILSVIPVRAEPDDRSEMVTQVLFGEYLTVTEKHKQWRKIICEYDQYEGWIDEKQISAIPENFFETYQSKTHRRTHQTTTKLLFNGEEMTLAKGALIVADEAGNLLWNKAYRIAESKENQQSLNETALSYLNAPYLWGGRTPFGIDCSGFTQMVFALHGKKLLRDAKDQIKQGVHVPFEERKANDLAFFVNDAGKIHHVGILISENEIIHSSGCVRIDTFNHEGIIHRNTGSQTHTFYEIRRIE